MTCDAVVSRAVAARSSGSLNMAAAVGGEGNREGFK